jgi:alkanesulfonate monooxygenase SsuD/methylene tetrahydromethanopterin reductase-like flavin-dependent oxidoreductase (luciferase family)
MPVNVGMFSMPFHPPHRPYADILREDRQAFVKADALGFTEAYVGEHTSSGSERVTAPLVFLASVLESTKRIRLGTGVINMPQHHPASVAADAAMFDHLSGGRFIMGVGPGSLASDVELFGIQKPDIRARMLMEGIDAVLKIWSQDPPYDIDGSFWKFSIKNAVWPEFQVGSLPRPLQQPHPPIALSLVTPNSSSAHIAGQRGWIPISGNFFNKRYLRGHWERYAEGCDKAGRRPDPGIWRVARCVLVTESNSEAEEYLSDSNSSLSYYYKFMRHSFSSARNALFMLKPDADMADGAATVDAIKRSQVIAGSPARVLEQLVALREEIGHFGTLLMTGHNWDRPAMWQRSMELLATDVMPRFSRHATDVEKAA